MEPTKEEKIFLLKIARLAIKSLFSDVNIPLPNYEEHPLYKTYSGAFVTITKAGKLRGCIGYIISDRPLFETICEAAKQAAINDPRFDPIEESELNNISIEISILSEPFSINNYDEIEIGKHGLILEEKGRRGLLLPQVPIEHNLNKEQYLDAICQKTGFPAGYWKTKQLKLSGFTACVFNEKELLIQNDGTSK